MFKVSVVLVDNLQDELDQLSQGFARAGIPCLPIKYESSAESSGIDYIEVDTSHVKIIAVDINLQDLQSPDAKAVYANIGNVLKKLKPSGPYCLIFWSSHADLPDEIMRLLQERMKDEITPPIAWGALDKKDFRADDNTPIPPSPDKLLEIIRKAPILESLINWESRVTSACSETLSSLLDISAANADSGWNAGEVQNNLHVILSHIAHEAVGRRNVADHENKAIEIGLLPVLEDHLIYREYPNTNELNTNWSDCLVDLGKNSLPGLSIDDSTRLNSFYLVDENVELFKTNDRGMFVEFNQSILSDDNSLKNYLGAEISLKRLINDEFLFNINEGTPDSREVARSSLVLGWLEIGATCDHAQRKNRLHRYLLGAIIPEEYESYAQKMEGEEIVKNRAHDAIYRFPKLYLNGAKVILKVSFRYQVGLPAEYDLLDRKLFRIKEQGINDVAFQWGKHGIRPGITSF